MNGALISPLVQYFKKRSKKIPFDCRPTRSKYSKSRPVIFDGIASRISNNKGLLVLFEKKFLKVLGPNLAIFILKRHSFSIKDKPLSILMQ